jgi:hypothetical protein
VHWLEAAPHPLECTVFVVGEHMGACSVLTGQGAIAKDGDVQFALKDFYQGESRDAPQSLGKAFIATIAVTNSGNGPQSFAARDQKLIDAADREYPAMGMVARPSPKHETTTLNVDPGVTLDVLIRFEGLNSTKPAAVELHQSTSSTGARISLH